MVNYLFLLITSLAALNIQAQNERFNLVEQAINAPEFVELVNQQTIFNSEKDLTIYIDSSLIEAKKYKFNKKEIGYYDISVPTNRMSVTYNFLFTQLNFNLTTAQVDFTFYPNWLIEINGNKNPTYNNGNLIKVACSFIKENNRWKLKSTIIHDIEFQDWMYEKGSGFDYITKNYVPLSK